jgi:hypothetical protein
MIVCPSTDRCMRIQVSAEKVHDAPRAGLIFVAEKADWVFVSDLTAVLTTSVARLYRVVINRKRLVKDCINAWPAGQQVATCGGVPCICPLFMRILTGFVIVSMTTSSIGTKSARDCLIFSHASIKETMSRACMRCMRSRTAVSDVEYCDNRFRRRDALNVPRVSMYTAFTSGIEPNLDKTIFESNFMSQDT